MKWLDFYKDKLHLTTEDDVFDYLTENFKPPVRLWDYFVNWDKVFAKTNEIEQALKKANNLIGRDDFDDAFRSLLKQDPSIIKIIPALIVRSGTGAQRFEMLNDYDNKKLTYDIYDFSEKSLTDEEVEKCLVFMKKAGLADLIKKGKITNLIDYMIGVEAGLDSNARKNRSGSLMENIVENFFIKDFCTKHQFTYKKEANKAAISKWGYDIPTNKANRKFDFAINTGRELLIIETNFYSAGGGSKLKATAGEYQTLFRLLGNSCRFIWITDGKGWDSVRDPLRETFNHNDYVFNLAMLEKGVLEYLL